MVDLSVYKGKKILITGHTGFKGAWLSQLLLRNGAEIIGYSLKPIGEQNLYERIGLRNRMQNVFGDIRDFDMLMKTFDEYKPEIVFHLAAQPLVRDSYKSPRYTYETNVMGTVNVMECVRLSDSVKSVINVTTDKVYQNNEWCWGYRELDPLDGFDPYSNSKSCSELVTHAYNNSFFYDKDIPVSTVRAGNVIGGGDFAKDRIIPDCVRAIAMNETIRIRNPYSIRPYQHVLEALAVYTIIAAKQMTDVDVRGYYNVGPDDCDCITTGELVDMLCKSWGEEVSWSYEKESNSLHEADFLKLDCSKIKKNIGWTPKWHINECMDRVCHFYKIWMENGDVLKEMNSEIDEYFA